MKHPPNGLHGERIPHGTHGRYAFGCRCAACRQAHTDAARARAKDHLEALLDLGLPDRKSGPCPGAGGTPCANRRNLTSRSRGGVCFECRARVAWNGLVDAAPARRHILALSKKGIGKRAVSEASDVPITTVHKIRSGTKKRIRKRTADAILAVDENAIADSSYVPAARTRAMVRELEAEYLTRVALAKALGYRSAVVQIGKKRVLARTEARIERFYRHIMGRDFR